LAAFNAAKSLRHRFPDCHSIGLDIDFRSPGEIALEFISQNIYAHRLLIEIKGTVSSNGDDR
jgi:hypothetical protein